MIDTFNMAVASIEKDGEVGRHALEALRCLFYGFVWELVFMVCGFKQEPKREPPFCGSPEK